MSNHIKVRVVRPVWLHGKPHAAGVILNMEPAAAADALETGRVELVDPADMPLILGARRAEVAQLMRREPQMLQPGSPWVAVR